MLPGIATPEAVMIDYDPFSADAMADPLPIYRELREHAPVYRLEQYDAWALSRFDDVWDVLQDLDGYSIVEGPIFDRSVLSSRRCPPFPEIRSDPLGSFTEVDPPVHTAVRQALGGPLRPGAVKALEPHIRALARDRLDELVPRGRFDVTLEYAGPVSAGVMSLVVGLPVDDAAALLDRVNRSFRRAEGRPGLTEEGLAARAEVTELLTTLVQRRREMGAPDEQSMIDRLIRTEIAGRSLRDAEVAEQVRSIVNGGTETVPKVVAGGLYELWRDPRQRTAVAADPEHAARAFEEMIRFGGPLQWVGRTLTRDAVVGGQQLRTGQRVFLLIASANRDEREFASPDRFLWDRPMGRHVGFGFGVHYCIGTHVARLEGRVLLEELLARIPDYDIDTAGILRPPSEFQIGYTQMPLLVR
jgi:cytochrome P450